MKRGEKSNYIHWSDYEKLIGELDKAEAEKDYKKAKKINARLSALQKDNLLRKSGKDKGQ